LLTVEDGNPVTPTLNSVSGLVKVNPILSFVFAISLFSLAGVPPLLGFYAKFSIFQSVLNGGGFFVASFVVLASVVSTFYYIRLVKSIFFENVNTSWIFYRIITAQHAVVISISFFIVVFFFYNPLILVLLAHKIALVALF